MIRVLIAHECPLFRAGLCSALGRCEDIDIVGQTVELEQLLKLTADTQPVVLIDGTLTCQPAFSAVEVVAQVRLAGAQGILVFAPSPEEEDLFRFLMSGAAAYELPSISGDHLVETIRCIARGEYLISSACLPAVSAKPSLQGASEEIPVTRGKQESFVYQEKQSHAFEISNREITILEEIKKGRSNKEIAKALRISDQTVKNHITSILKKLDVHDRTAAVVVAIDHGLISLEDAKRLHGDKKTMVQRAQHFPGSEAASQQNRVPSYAMVANA